MFGALAALAAMVALVLLLAIGGSSGSSHSTPVGTDNSTRGVRYDGGPEEESSAASVSGR